MCHINGTGAGNTGSNKYDSGQVESGSSNSSNSSFNSSSSINSSSSVNSSSSESSHKSMSAGFNSKFAANSVDGVTDDYYSGYVDNGDGKKTTFDGKASELAGGGMQQLMQLLQQIMDMLKSSLGGASSSESTGKTAATGETGKPSGEVDSPATSDDSSDVTAEGTGVKDGSDVEDSSDVKDSSHVKDGSDVEEGSNTEGADGKVDTSTQDTSTAASSGSSTPSKSGIEEMDQWDSAIAKAAESTGLPANYIKATLYAESRGNPDDQSTNPDGQHQDMGLMQISDYTYGLVMDSQPDAPRGLDVNNPEENIMAGAWELKDKSEQAGGDLVQTSAAYVGHGDDSDNVYADAVQHFMECLDNGQPLPDEYNGF